MCLNMIELLLVVERDVIHAEVRLQALKGAVRCVHGTATAVAIQSHRVGDDRVYTRWAVGKLKCFIVQVPVCAHMLVHIAEWYLDDRVLKGGEIKTVSLQKCCYNTTEATVFKQEIHLKC